MFVSKQKRFYVPSCRGLSEGCRWTVPVPRIPPPGDLGICCSELTWSAQQSSEPRRTAARVTQPATAPARVQGRGRDTLFGCRSYCVSQSRHIQVSQTRSRISYAKSKEKSPPYKPKGFQIIPCSCSTSLLSCLFALHPCLANEAPPPSRPGVPAPASAPASRAP